MSSIENRVVEYQLGLIRKYLSEIVDTVDEVVERIVDMMDIKVVGKKMEIREIDMTMVSKKLRLIKRKMF